MNRWLKRAAVAALFLTPTAAMAAATPNFTAPTGMDSAALITEVITANKTLILAGAGGVAFLGILARVRKGYTRGAGKTAA
jgi:hypothetical protein